MIPSFRGEAFKG